MRDREENLFSISDLSLSLFLLTLPFFFPFSRWTSSDDPRLDQEEKRESGGKERSGTGGHADKKGGSCSSSCIRGKTQSHEKERRRTTEVHPDFFPSVFQALFPERDLNSKVMMHWHPKTRIRGRERRDTGRGVTRKRRNKSERRTRRTWHPEIELLFLSLFSFSCSLPLGSGVTSSLLPHPSTDRL